MANQMKKQSIKRGRIYKCFRCGWTIQPVESTRVLIDDKLVYVNICKSCRKETFSKCDTCGAIFKSTDNIRQQTYSKSRNSEKIECTYVIQVCEKCSSDLIKLKELTKEVNVCKECKYRFDCLIASKNRIWSKLLKLRGLHSRKI